MKQENKKNEQNDEVQRNADLIKDRTGKMALTYIGSTICVVAVTAVDSLIAGISIGGTGGDCRCRAFPDHRADPALPAGLRHRQADD